MTTTWSTCTGTSKERVSILHTRTAMTTIMSIIMTTTITMIMDTATTITTRE